jgi:hypothetical protein
VCKPLTAKSVLGLEGGRGERGETEGAGQREERQSPGP